MGARKDLSVSYSCLTQEEVEAFCKEWGIDLKIALYCCHFEFSNLCHPFSLVWRHPDAVLNELEPFESEIDSWLLKSIRECPSRLRPFSRTSFSADGC
ncbi:hypothetical protein HanRHA438_Chr10g0440251 [Helianthus annuus]|nr:hypothetical protein HanRHA438_Chr10g0440251 [Helianthus annuus]KAJ0882719.1 hypothetical protein HanPSC8_Chr10g0412961 [Helianthus annuus]